MRALGRPEMAEDPRFATNAKRVENEKEIDDAISAWTGARASADALEALRKAGVPNGPIYNVADMMADPHFNARGMFESVEVNGRPLKIPALPPLLGETPGRTDAPGPALGAHTDEVLESLLGLQAEARAELRASNVI
jgi:crotonobetainyl-CoA:carnitine CoA-transferase CaiB-like acyl-CoA transferase